MFKCFVSYIKLSDLNICKKKESNILLDFTIHTTLYLSLKKLEIFEI